jgi:hypothetical protein
MINRPDACEGRVIRFYGRSIRKIGSKEEKKRVYRDSGNVEGFGFAGKAEEERPKSVNESLKSINYVRE